MARILLLTHEFEPFRGGIAAVADGLARGAASAGHAPIVFAPAYGARHEESDRERPYSVHRFPGSTCSMVSMDGLVRFTKQCAREIRRTQADVIHAVDPPSQMALTMLARFGRVHTYFFTVHGTELIRYRDELLPRLWMGRGLRRAKSVHAVSRAVYRLLPADGLSAPRHAFVEPPGIRRTWLDRPVADRAAVRALWDATETDLVLLTLARRVPEKGQAEVIAAIDQLPDELRRRIVYVIAGHGPEDYARALEQSADAAGVRIVLTGSITDEAAIAACDSADLFVMLSRMTHTRLEGFGIAYIEAGSRGLPSLARETGGVAEAVLHGETGMVVPGSADNTLIGSALDALLRDPALRSRLGAGARAYATDFAWESRAMAVYDRFLGRL
jgi:glycosyltransferase involved in cell wall biosynthesis